MDSRSCLVSPAQGTTQLVIKNTSGFTQTLEHDAISGHLESVEVVDASSTDEPQSVGRKVFRGEERKSKLLIGLRSTIPEISWRV